MKLIQVFIIFSFLLCGGLSAQDFPGGNLGAVPDNSDTTQNTGGLRDGKLLDDSTKQIYGPTTSRYFYESSLKYNRLKYHTIDTLIDNLHRFNYINAQKNMYQDLGNIGTASRSVYYQIPSQIGVTSGITIYDLYARGSDAIKYYDTRSPFTDLNIVLGGNGRATTLVSYSRNVNTRWNVGFDYRGLFIDKQVQRAGKGDTQVLSHAYDLYTSYLSKDSTYHLLFNFTRNRHRVVENGGIIAQGKGLAGYFNDNAQLTLQAANTEELRTNFHFYHQYRFNKLIQAYHQLDRHKQMNTFRDDLTRDTKKYDITYLDQKASSDQVDFHTTTSEQGVKGDLGPLFYNVYHKYRYFDMEYNHVNSDTIGFENNGNEQYGGAKVRLAFDSLTYLEGGLEYLVGSNYHVRATIKGKWYEASIRRIKYDPSFIQKYYYGNHARWDNRFTSIKVDELKGSINYESDYLMLRPFARWVLLNDYVYYDDKRKPRQVSDLQLLSGGLELSANLKKRLFFTGMGIYASVQGNNREVMRVPRWLFNAKLYYQNIIFDGNLQFQLGIDAHWKSSYLADAYYPAIQQFHLQNSFSMPERFAVDVFANLKINRGRLFVKYVNLLKAFQPIGYFASPYHIGQVNLIDFGFKWAFYD